MTRNAQNVKLFCLFFMSGFAALIYEVLFSKQLGHVFGSTSIATYTVLSTYMGGMALGAWFGGRLAPRLKSAISIYVACEAGIAIFCVISPAILFLIRLIYVELAAGRVADFYYLFYIRFALGFLALFTPTFLMGMTLPLLVSVVVRNRGEYASAVSLLYGANTLGASLGALVSGYFLLPVLGVFKTNLLAVSLNFSVAILAMHWAHGFSGLSGKNDALDEPSGGGNGDYWFATILLVVVGFSCMALEVLYMHMLAVVVGNSVFAFSLMLFSFLFGLGWGGLAAGRVRFLQEKPALGLVLAMLVLSSVIAGYSWSWENIPGYFASFYGYKVQVGFGGREFIRAVVCVLIMIPPSFCIGIIYPVAMGVVGRCRGVRGVGVSSSLNTLGNIAGVIVSGVVFIPLIGAFSAIKLVAGLVFFAAALCGVLLSFRKEKFFLIVFCFSAACLIGMPRRMNYDEISSGANVYFSPQNWGRVVDVVESADGGLTSVHLFELPSGGKVKTLTTNGKFQGNDSGEMAAQIGFSLVPLYYVNDRSDALVVGYGTGMTANALRHAGFRRIEIAELSQDVFDVADKHFRYLNGGVREAQGVVSSVVDGRNYLLLEKKNFDLITVELTSIWFAGAAALYNSEFYELARARLKPGGVLQQWVQLHHMTKSSLVSVISTISSQFKYVELYSYGGQGMLVARNDAELGYPSSDPFSEPMIQKFVGTFGSGDVGLDKPVKILDSEAVRRLVNSRGVDLRYLVSTDDNSFLEYDTPRGNALDSIKSYQENLDFLKSYQ